MPCRDALVFVSITSIVVAGLFAFVYISYKLCFCSPQFFVSLLVLNVTEGFHFHVNICICMSIAIYAFEAVVGFGCVL